MSGKKTFTFRLDDTELRDDCVAIARARGTRDRLGDGLSAELRLFLAAYRRKHRHLLNPDVSP